MDAATAIVTSIRDLGIGLQVISRATGLSVSMLSEIAHSRRPRVRCSTVAKLRAADTDTLIQAYPGIRHLRLVEHLNTLRDAGITDRAIATRAGLHEDSLRRARSRLPQTHVYEALMCLELHDFPDHVHIDATLATRRLDLLLQFLPATQITALTGIDQHTLTNLRHGRVDHLPLKAHAALFALPVPTTPHPALPITSWEAHRRIRALLAAGWGTRRIADASGLTRDTVRALITSPHTTVATATRAIAASKRLATQTPPQDNPARRARAYATQIGAHPLSAWTASSITDPEGIPLAGQTPAPTHPHQLHPLTAAGAGGAEAPRKPTDPRRGVKQVWIEDIEDLAHWGACWPEIEARTGISRDSIQRTLLRHDRTDLTKHISANTTGVVA